jgi:hypothetical protein
VAACSAAGEAAIGPPDLMRRVMVGLGPADRVERIVVRRPSGRIETWTVLAADRALELVEGRGRRYP